ncbi:MAG: type I-F CRISPR-associated protein Csy1 [Methylococcales bacterium]
MIEKTEIERFIGALKTNAVKAKIESVISENKVSNESYKMSPKEKKIISESFDEQYEVVTWIDEVLNVDLSAISSFIPNDKQIELFEFLSLNFSYKTTLKEDFDNNLLRLREHLENYSAEKFIVWQLKIKQLNPDLIPLYLFFKEFIAEAKNQNITPCQLIQDEVSVIAKYATSGTMISHASKFSHPAATYPRLFINKEFEEDGFVRTGNAEVDFDLHINSAYLKVYRFLSLRIDGKSIKDYLIAESTNSVLSLFCSDGKIIHEWQESFNKCLNSQNEQTNQLIKQVYFPIDKDSYHLLSIVFPSRLAFELKKRIEIIKYSDESILAKRDEKKDIFNEHGFSTISNITLQRYGGDHPKNISALNNKYQDVYLLDSCPPALMGINKTLPKKSLFDSLWRKIFLNEIRGLHRILRAENEDVPQKRSHLINKYLQRNPDFQTVLIKQSKGDITDGIQPHHLNILFNIIIKSMLDQIIEKIWIIRAEEKNWTSGKRFKSLAKKQKILLDQYYIEERSQSDDWFVDFNDKCTNWIIEGYKKELADKQLPLSKEHKKSIQKVIAKNKQVLL